MAFRFQFLTSKCIKLLLDLLGFFDDGIHSWSHWEEMPCKNGDDREMLVAEGYNTFFACRRVPTQSPAMASYKVFTWKKMWKRL